MQIRQLKYLNNIVEQDHRFMKKRVRSILGFKTFQTDQWIICGIENMHMLKKEQISQRETSVQHEVAFIHQLFGVVASFITEKENTILLCF